MARAKKDAKPAGRPSDFTTELADELCLRIAEGKSLRSICTADDMPDRSTVLRWLAMHADFAAKYAHARTMQADVMDDLILETAETCTNESAQADRVKIAAYQWRASKLAPKKYGDKIAHVGGGPDDEPIQTNVVVRFVETAEGE